MPPSTESSASLSPGEAAFAEFLALEEERPGLDFDAFCDARPELADYLRRLRERWLGFKQAVSTDLGADAPAQSGTASLLAGLRRQSATESRYVPSEEIGRGGMGRVLKVWDKDLRRSLAMKVLLERGKADPRSLARFLDEAQITGQLEHPGIVPVHELGLDAEGRVYFTMPFVRGESFERIIKRVQSGEPAGQDAGRISWSRARAIGVLLRVCEAVGYAHARGVVHRDLKPANVMVGPFGETYVMDWGLARIRGESDRVRARAASGEPPTPAASTDLRSLRSAAGDEEPGSPLSTMEGDVVGTPVYMAPEQAHGWMDQVGPATDVYSIGAMLYQLLTGRRPYLSETENDSPEQVLSAVKSRPPKPIHALAGDVPPELEAICEKAMARAPGDRYAETMELAADLRAFLEQRVVAAFETGAGAELKKWIARNRRLSVAIGAALLAVVAGLGVSTVLFLRATRNEGAAIAAQERADTNAHRLAVELRASNVERGRMLARFGPVLQGEELLWTEFLQDIADPHARWALWEMYALTPNLQTLKVHGGLTARIRFAGGDELITFGDDGLLRAWKVGALTPQREVHAHDGKAGTLELSPDGRLAATVGAEDGVLRLWSVADFRPVASVAAHVGGAHDVAFARDGTRVATAGVDGRAIEWSVPGLEALRELDAGDGQITTLRYDEAGELLVLGTDHGNVHVWRAPGRKPASDGREPARSWPAHPGRGIYSLALTADGRILTGGSDRRIASWSLDGELLAEREADNGTIRDILVAPDGRTAMAVGWYRVEFFDPVTLAVVQSYALPRSAYDIAQSGDGALIGVTHQAGMLRLFEAEPRGHLTTLGAHAGATTVLFHPDGRTIMSGDEAGVLRFFDTQTNRVLREVREHHAQIDAMDVSADGSVLVTGDTSGAVQVRHLPTDTLLLERDDLHCATRYSLDLSPDGTLLALVVGEARVLVIDVATGTEHATVAHDATEALSVVLLPELGLLATTAREPFVRLWTLDGEPTAAIKTGAAPWTLERDARGRLATGTWSGSICMLDPAARTSTRELRGHWGTVWHVRFHPTDPNLLASTADDGTVRLWDLDADRVLLTCELGALLGRAGSALSFSPDGKRLAVGGQGDPIVIDLEYYERHMAGNALAQLELLREMLGGTVDEDAIRAWAEPILARPWPSRAR